MSHLSIDLDAKISARLSDFAAAQDKSIGEIITEAVDYWLDHRYGKDTWDEGGTDEAADEVDAAIMADNKMEVSALKPGENRLWSADEVRARYGLDT
ncbi:MAG: hypothetical protein QM537_04805 [Candidatus Symbiobacter sp.]|nr:hypothetical protein [Candidatus Symbiobacter sp.]